MIDFNNTLIEDFRRNRGRVTIPPFTGRDLLLLTTHGARTNEDRVAPVMFGRDGDRYFVIASKGGAPTHPAWYLNILANPDVTLEVGGETFQAKATVAEGAERRRLYDAMVAVAPQFAEYERNTDREIPVVVLERVQS
jgi:deazaflavin-dependent oxidoreductase (nitroreductase family)